jgi:mRNA interferase RelE/StbE
MASYNIIFMPSTEKDLKSIPRKDLKKIVQRIDSLAVNPRPYGCEKLTEQNRYRIRQGDYRIIYTIHDNELVIWIVKVGHRKDIYRVSEEKEKFNTNNP